MTSLVWTSNVWFSVCHNVGSYLILPTGHSLNEKAGCVSIMATVTGSDGPLTEVSDMIPIV